MKKLIISLLLVGCQSASTHVPTLSPIKNASVQDNSNTEFICSANSKSSESLVRLNFVMLKKEVDANPEVVSGLRDALIEWAAYLPIEIMITIDETDFSIDLLCPRAMSGGILVRMTDIQAMPINMDKNVLGAYDGSHNVLYLDSGKTKDLSYLVSLHEVGHALGLPHILPTKSTIVSKELSEGKSRLLISFGYALLLDTRGE